MLIGRLTKDTELRYTKSNIPCCQFSIAVSRNYKNEQGDYETDYFNIICWHRQAETCAEYLKKGDRVGIEGKLQSRNYEDKEGNKRVAIEVVADNIDFLQTRKEYDGLSIKTQEVKSDTLNLSIDEDELPF